MERGKHVILPVAGAILDHARMPVTSPRRSHADMRRDGSTTAPTVLNPPSMSAEDCTAHRDSKAGTDRQGGSPAGVGYRGASQGTLESRRRRWPQRKPRPRLRLQDKSAASGVAHVVGRIGDFGHPADATRWRFCKKQQRFQTSERHPSVSATPDRIMTRRDDDFNPRPGRIRHGDRGASTLSQRF
jgi:hypothetical protein